MQSHLYDYMIDDESYGICGGSFPLYENDEFVGTITFTGLRPQEDHGVIIQVLEKVFQERNWNIFFCDIYNAFYIYLLFLIC